MQSNVAYLRRELPNVTLPAEDKARLEWVLDEFDSLLYDLRNEAHNLEDKLGMHPGEAPNDPGLVNPDPRVALGFLREWPMKAFHGLHAVAQGLNATAQEDPGVGPAFVLVAESAANMLNAYSGLQNVLGRIETGLAAAGG